MTPELPENQRFISNECGMIYYHTEHKKVLVTRHRTKLRFRKDTKHITELLNHMLRHLLNSNQPCVVDKMIMEILNKED